MVLGRRIERKMCESCRIKCKYIEVYGPFKKNEPFDCREGRDRCCVRFKWNS